MNETTYAIFDRANYDTIADALKDKAVNYHTSTATREQLSALLDDLPSVSAWVVEELPPKYVTIRAEPALQERLLAAVVAATEHPKTPRTGLGFATVNCSPSLQKWISIEGLEARYHYDESTIEAAEREFTKRDLQLSRVDSVEVDRLGHLIAHMINGQVLSACTHKGALIQENEVSQVDCGVNLERNHWYLSRYDDQSQACEDVISFLAEACALRGIPFNS